MIIDYGDGTIERTGGRFGHTYSENGTYQVKIYGVTSLETNCFRDCSGLTAITLPDSISNLGTYCFYGCTSLTSIIIPNSVTDIKNCCFKSCTNLTSIRLSWKGTNILTYEPKWIVNTSSTLKFSIPLGTTTEYTNKSYPFDKLVERD